MQVEGYAATLAPATLRADPEGIGVVSVGVVEADVEDAIAARWGACASVQAYLEATATGAAVSYTAECDVGTVGAYVLEATW